MSETDMTDRNIHAEPICDWSDLPTTGCAHCHGRHDNPEPIGIRTPPARPGRPVDLGGYRGEPYYRRAESLPIPDHGPICACGRPAGDAFVCPACLDVLEVHLGDVPALVEDLEVAAQRRDRVTITARRARMPVEPLSVLDGDFWSSDPSSGVLRDSGASDVVTVQAVAADITRRWLAILGRTRPDRKAASDALDTLHSELVSAARALLEPIRQDYPGDPSTVGLSRWLLAHTRSIAGSPAGPDIAAGIAQAHRRALSVIDNAPELIHYGYCTGLLSDGEEAIECDNQIAVPIGAGSWKCPRCGRLWIVAELDQWRTELVADTLGTVGEIVRWARLLKRKTTKRQIRNWIERGRMHDRGEGLDEQGRRAKLYRLGDALDLCDTSRAKGA